MPPLAHPHAEQSQHQTKLRYMTYLLSLHIFRRDLRLEDNSALIAALQQSKEVIPCFIFDKRQIELNDYKSEHCLEFMANSLQELNQQLQTKQSHLYQFYGITEEIVDQLLGALPIKAVFINRDYTPFSRKRDQQIERVCKKHQVDFHCYADALLHEPEQVLKADGTPYTVFTHAYKRALMMPVAPPQKNSHDNYYHDTIAFENNQTLNKLLQKPNPHLFVKGGRKEGLTLIKKMSHLANYVDLRNIPAKSATTHLSAHHKFGTISIREVYQAITNAFDTHHALITELHWRDFFTHIAYHFPRVFGAPFHEKYKNINWRANEKHFRAWCEGYTGFPIVDAGMRELNTTGYMHNRVRMIVASFLTKDLHIDWRWGEKYFAQKLVDYDPAVNNGNWQWAASIGCDAQPYFRIFNPWLQQQKFDPDCLYIKKWIPELSAIPNKTIHQLNENRTMLMKNYPNPIVNHTIESEKAKLMYKI